MTTRGEALEVWAPQATRLELELCLDDGSHKRLPMKGVGGGRFTLPRAMVVGPYQLRVDGGDPIPDPRAESVRGVLGPCALVDHDAFRWTDAAFEPPPLQGGLLYELHIGTFSEVGTFDGAIEKLRDLQELGVTHVELMPVAAFSGRWGWGYDGAALFAPHPAYGGPEGLKRLVDACHAHGLAVIVDVVYNHLGSIGNFLGCYGPYFQADRHTPWGSAVNFDGPDCDEVRRFFIDNALGWLRHYHVDGLRLDAVHAIHDESAVPFLEELAGAVRDLSAELKKELLLIAESDLNDPRLIRPVEAHGLGLTAQWCDDFHHALHVVLTGETAGYYADFAGETGAPLAHLQKALTRGFVYDGQRSPHRRRRHGRPLSGLSLSRLIGYAQTHDQVGNRARGERLSQLVSPGKQKIALALVLTGPFTPMLFMGEEWGASTPFLFFTDHEDPAIAEATRKGRRSEFATFGWRPEDVPDPQSETTFLQSKLRWAEREMPPHRDVLAFTRALVALRRQRPCLQDGAAEGVRVHVGDDALFVERGDLLVVVNLGQERPLRFPEGLANGRRSSLPGTAGRLLLASEDDVTVNHEGVHMPEESVAIIAMG